jgi:ankyrin repeat protein
MNTMALLIRRIIVLLAMLAWSVPAFCEEIHDAAKRGDLAKIKALLKANPHLIISKDIRRHTALHWAANKNIAELLIANKADVMTREENGGTPLHFAAESGNKDVAEVLIAHGADVNAKDKSGRTPLHKAANKDVAELLLAKGANIKARISQGGTPLHEAAKNGRPDVVEFLLAKGVNVNFKANQSITPLHCAAESGNKDVAEVLLTHGAEVNAKDFYSRTPLHKAANKDVAIVLLAHGANANAKDFEGLAPLYSAANNDVAEVLLAKRAVGNEKDGDGDTPLRLSAIGADIDGKWEGQFRIEANPKLNIYDTFKIYFTFKSDGKKLAGTSSLIVNGGERQISQGKIKGKGDKISFAIHIMGRKYEFNGKINGNKMKLTGVWIPPFGSCTQCHGAQVDQCVCTPQPPEELILIKVEEPLKQAVPSP